MSDHDRIMREKQMINNRVISLSEVKRCLTVDTKTDSSKFFFNQTFSKNLFEKFSYYLHYIIMVKFPKDLSIFLENHYKSYGQYATEIFVNYPLVCMADKNIVTPLMCASMWTNDPVMVRILYQWGADFSLTDVNGRYPEEKYGTYYINHLNHIISHNNFILGIRNHKDFTNIITEIKYITGESKPPSNWRLPSKIYNPLIYI